MYSVVKRLMWQWGIPQIFWARTAPEEKTGAEGMGKVGHPSKNPGYGLERKPLQYNVQPSARGAHPYCST